MTFFFLFYIRGGEGLRRRKWNLWNTRRKIEIKVTGGKKEAEERGRKKKSKRSI